MGEGDGDGESDGDQEDVDGEDEDIILVRMRVGLSSLLSRCLSHTEKNFFVRHTRRNTRKKKEMPAWKEAGHFSSLLLIYLSRVVGEECGER